MFAIQLPRPSVTRPTTKAGQNPHPIRMSQGVRKKIPSPAMVIHPTLWRKVAISEALVPSRPIQAIVRNVVVGSATIIPAGPGYFRAKVEAAATIRPEIKVLIKNIIILEIYYTPVYYQGMSHTTIHKKRILARVSRIQGQLKAVAAGMENEDDCGKVLQTLAAAKGALNGLMMEILEDHIQHHIIAPKKTSVSSKDAGFELISVLRSYLK